MATEYVASGDVRIYDVRAILADAFSAKTLNRVIVVIKSHRPSISFIALPHLRSLLAEDFSAKNIDRATMALKCFCVKAHL